MLAFAFWMQAVATDAGVMMPDEARALSTVELADRLLPSDHPPIVWSQVHPDSRETPMPWIRSIDLMAKAGPAKEAGFCATKLYTIGFVPVGVVTPGKIPPVPARPIETKVQTLYRLPATGRPNVQTCSGRIGDFFRISPAHQREELALARLFAKARQAILEGDTGIALSFDDELADDMERLDRENPERLKAHRRFDDRITDAHIALARMPIDDINSISSGASSYSINDATEKARERAESGAQIAVIIAGSGWQWQAEMVTQAGRVVALHVVRRIPPPF